MTFIEHCYPNFDAQFVVDHVIYRCLRDGKEVKLFDLHASAFDKPTRAFVLPVDVLHDPTAMDTC